MLAKVLPVVESADAAFFASIDLKNSKMVTTLQILARANLSKKDGEFLIKGPGNIKVKRVIEFALSPKQILVYVES